MVNISNILRFLDSINVEYNYIGQKHLSIRDYSPLNNIKDSSLTWSRRTENIDLRDLISHDKVIIVLSEKINDGNINQIIVKNPHRVFFQILSNFFSDEPDHHIHESAVIDSKNIGENLSVGANSYIGRDTIIGDNVTISSNVSIEGKVNIGDNTVIEAGVVIGVDGFGHYKDENNISVRVPHLGSVSVGTNVIIGANTTICRGCLGDTIIGDYVRIDNLCHIAHNVQIKSRSMITACTEISGSTIVEEDVWIGPASALNNGIVIGKNSFVGIGTVATKDVPESKVVVGVPARVIKDNV